MGKKDDSSQVPLISNTNRKKRLHIARADQNWTVEDWKNVTFTFYI